MSKDRNYTIVLGGIFVIIGIIVFGVIKYFIFQPENIDLQKQVIDFLTFVIPSSIGTALTMASILNLVEKKELKAVTKLNTEYSTKFIEKLEGIQTIILEIRQNELDREEESLLKEKEHLQVHKQMDNQFKELKNQFDAHIENHT